MLILWVALLVADVISSRSGQLLMSCVFVLASLSILTRDAAGRRRRHKARAAASGIHSSNWRQA